MQDLIRGAEAVSLFCRININTKRNLPIRSGEMGLLIYLVKTDGPVTSVDAARFFRVSKPMVATMVRALEKGGYIEKQKSETDARSFILAPTAQAEKLVEETYREYYKTMELLRRKMGEDEYETLINSLQKANAILLEASEKENGDG